MPARLGTLVLVASLSLLAACSNGDDDATPPPSPTSSSTSPPAGDGAESAALRLKGQAGTGTSCLPKREGTSDYLWSGTWLAARDDVTITGAAPGSSSAMEMVGSWIVEDGKDHGEFVPWSSDVLVDRTSMVRARGAELTAGTAYRVVLRLRPMGKRSSEVTGIVVRYRDASGGGSLTDPSTLRIATTC